jgi:hypothetical protein
MFAVTFSVGAYAQQNSTEENTRLPYKLEKGSVTTELNFSPFSFNLNFDGENFSTEPFTMPGLRVRVGLNNKWALRANLQLDFGHNKIQQDLDNFYDDPYWRQTTTGTRIGKESYTQFAIAPGVEYHFGKWERLSIYVGGEVLLGFRVSQSSYELDRRDVIESREWGSDEWKWHQTRVMTSSMKTKNCSYSGGDYYSQTGKTFFGINALAGFDFYVYKGLYLGAELGLGYTHSWAMKGTVKGDSETTTTTTAGIDIEKSSTDKEFNDKITGGNLGFRCNPMIRLGWRF